MNPELFLVTGISGSGKTTVARALNALGEVAFDSKLNHGLYHFVDDSGKAIENPDWSNGGTPKEGKWVLNRPMLEQLLAQHHVAKRVFLCGKANIFQYWEIADAVFLLKVTETTLRSRLNSKSRDNLFARDNATQQSLARSLVEQQEKLVSRGAIAIDAEKPVKEVVAQILAETEKRI